MRILEFIDTLDIGGAERMASCLSLQLQAMGHEVDIVCLREFGSMPVAAERLQGAGVSLMAFGKKDGFSPALVWKLACFLKEHHIDVLHGHNPFVAHYAAAAGRIARTPGIVSTIHGTNTLIMSSLAEKLFTSSCRWNDRIVLVCKQVEQVFQQRFARLANRTAVIPNGIEADELLSISRHPSSADKFVWGTVGRLAPVKDQETLLHAFAQIHVQFPTCRLEILGDGALMKDLQDVSKSLGIDASVKFHGWGHDVAGFLSGIDGFVLSSKSEGLSMSLLEAMASGLPIAATAVGGTPEVIEGAGCGWLAKPSEAASIAESMLKVMTAPDRLECGARARKAVLERYSVQVMARQYEELFRTVTLR